MDDDPLTETLERVSRELRAMAASVDDLEHALAAVPRARGTPVREMQSLDAIRQGVAGVADFLDALNEAMPAGWRVDAGAASRVVTLADMAARLAGHDGAPFAPPELYELF